MNNLTHFNSKNNLKNIQNENNCDFLRQKIIELKKEINKKNILINEYTELTKESKKKFQQIILMNKQKSFNISQKYSKIIQKYKDELNKVMKQNKDLVKENNDIKNYNKALEDIIIKLNCVKENENKNNNEENGKVIKKLLEENLSLKKQIKGNSKDMNNLNENIKTTVNNEQIKNEIYKKDNENNKINNDEQDNKSNDINKMI